MDKYGVLSHYFGYSSFREGQEKVIDSILSGRDTLAIMPTGAGKSLCFQVPALVFDGVTIVVSPLISLMKDQVNALIQNGVKAAYINGSLNERQIELAISRAARGEYKIIYVAPERLFTYTFRNLMNCIKVSLLCVDEAHCVSQWGQDFRPSYLQIKDFVDSFYERPIVCAMTATATYRVREDIIDLIGLIDPSETVLSFDRKNLYFEAIKPKSKPKELRKYLDLYAGRSGIVYCSSRKRTEELFDSLSAEGYSVTKYHAGLTPEERKRNQDLFINDEKEIIIATNAFGMGIDKSNVSFVIHYNMPGDIESYYQEAGRAGRDGNNADCILFCNAIDIRTQQFFIDNPEENDELSLAEKEHLRKLRMTKLQDMIDYSSGRTCLRNFMLRYFGEEVIGDCGNCSVCNGRSQSTDITVDAQKVFSCIVRMKNAENMKILADVLKGNTDEYIISRGYDKLTTFGIMESVSLANVNQLITHLISSGYIKQSDGNLRLNEKANDILFGKRKISVSSTSDKIRNTSVSEPDVDPILFGRLRELCMKIAKTKSVPAFVIFTDATLKAFAAVKPTTSAEFLQISGVGEAKLKKFGAVFIKEICAYIEENRE
ncbi:MAG: DNA helicase RecQ [Faecalibacterium sp.]|nr:DNA helicase RecQ [Ruminococcus sp.]MCM1391415.1 DNA helicase RecQ [Ruminococcus sp.]MCM1485089.1 DNA helicase RecQ [Faecalibacterium sp.]